MALACRGPGGRGRHGWLMRWPGGGQRGDVEMFSVCGTRSELVRRLGQFTYESRWLWSGAASGAGGWWRSTVAPSRRRSSCTWARPATVIPGCCGRSSLPFLPTWRRAVTPSPGTAQTFWRTPHGTGRRRSRVRSAVKVLALQKFTGKAWQCARRHSWCAGSARSPRGGGQGSGKG